MDKYQINFLKGIVVGIDNVDGCGNFEIDNEEYKGIIRNDLSFCQMKIKFPDDYDYFYTCGPLPMFKAVYYKTQCSGQFSFEERMGCGFGACMGCSCKTKYGNKRICKDGPVLVKEEIIW